MGLVSYPDGGRKGVGGVGEWERAGEREWVGGREWMSAWNGVCRESDTIAQASNERSVAQANVDWTQSTVQRSTPKRSLQRRNRARTAVAHKSGGTPATHVGCSQTRSNRAKEMTVEENGHRD
jgi:hypothetical protein